MIKTFTLKNDFLEVTILNLGCIIHEIKMPNRDGVVENIIHGFKNIEDYKQNDAYFGAVIGRTSGRINKGTYTLNGVTYKMPTVDRGNGLHGGTNGFDKQFWTGKQSGNQLELSYVSPSGEEGFPGTVEAVVTYTLCGEKLILEYTGESDQDTLLNMTNHSYFNLNPSETILDMKLRVSSDYLIAINETSIPTGELMDVTDTPFDFRVRKSIGKDLYKEHIQLARGGGYDHPWKLTGGVELSAENGRRVTMTSDQNCVVLYSYNFPLEGHRKHQGLAVEFQSEPDGLHHEGFSDGILKKGDLYSQKTVYEFKVD